MGKLQATDRADLERRLQDCAAALERIARLCGVELEMRKLDGAGEGDPVRSRVLVAGRETGWCVVASGRGEEARRAAHLASELIGQMLIGQSDLDSLSGELADCYEELNFLYDMSAKVGALLEEKSICEFVIEKAAWMLECERASLMLFDRESESLKIYASVGLPEEIVATVRIKPGEGISGRVLQSAKEIVVGENDPLPPDALRLKELEQSDSFLSIPLITSHEDRAREVIGVVNLTRKKGGRMFTSSDLKLIEAVAAQTATQIYNCRLLRAERERRELERELKIAAEIQLSLLPEEPLCVGRLEAAGLCRQARNVGGDFLDYWHRDGRASMLVADVCGHDLGAALLASELRSIIRSQSVHVHSVAQLLREVNHTMFDDLCRSELLVTLFYAEVDLESGTLTYCRAGHPRPLLLRETGPQGQREATWLEEGGAMLGIEEETSFDENSVQLKPGDTLLIYSDGLVEATDANGKNFGTQGVLEAALRFCALRPAELAARIVDCAQDYLADPVIKDDMTVLAARYGGS